MDENWMVTLPCAHLLPFVDLLDMAIVLALGVKALLATVFVTTEYLLFMIYPQCTFGTRSQTLRSCISSGVNLARHDCCM
jgi:hypothetical protein